MTVDAGVAARYNVRLLLPGPEDALRDAVLRLGVQTAQLQTLARHAAVEALAVEGLASDQTRVLERMVRERGGEVLSSADGDRAVILAPLLAAGQLPALLAEWNQSAGELGGAIGAALIARGAAPPPVNARGHQLVFGRRTLVMGILNVTPDSFSGDGVGSDVGAAVARAQRLEQEGADVIDVGGESTRPSSTPVDEEQELRRVIPVLRALRDSVRVPLSIDTRKPGVASAAIDEGAAIVNDIWGLRGDAAMAGVLAQHPDVAVIVMHNQRGTEYPELVAAVMSSLRQSVAIAVHAGIAAEQVICDPGFGFGKTPAQNLELMRRLGELRALGRPLLIGVSRKHTIGVLTDDALPAERVEGGVALATLGIVNGAHMVRTHDVADTLRGLRVADAVVRGTPDHVRQMPAPGPTG